METCESPEEANAPKNLASGVEGTINLLTSVESFFELFLGHASIAQASSICEPILCKIASSLRLGTQILVNFLVRRQKCKEGAVGEIRELNMKVGCTLTRVATLTTTKPNKANMHTMLSCVVSRKLNSSEFPLSCSSFWDAMTPDLFSLAFECEDFDASSSALHVLLRLFQGTVSDQIPFTHALQTSLKAGLKMSLSSEYEFASTLHHKADLCLKMGYFGAAELILKNCIFHEVSQFAISSGFLQKVRRTENNPYESSLNLQARHMLAKAESSFSEGSLSKRNALARIQNAIGSLRKCLELFRSNNITLFICLRLQFLELLASVFSLVSRVKPSSTSSAESTFRFCPTFIDSSFENQFLDVAFCDLPKKFLVLAELHLVQDLVCSNCQDESLCCCASYLKVLALQCRLMSVAIQQLMCLKSTTPEQSSSSILEDLQNKPAFEQMDGHLLDKNFSPLVEMCTYLAVVLNSNHVEVKKSMEIRVNDLAHFLTSILSVPFTLPSCVQLV